MTFLVSVHYSCEQWLEQTEFGTLPEAQAFFILHLQQVPEVAVEVWLKRQENQFEQYLLDYRKLLPLKSKTKTGLGQRQKAIQFNLTLQKN
jgi:hypothetical protein